MTKILNVLEEIRSISIKKVFLKAGEITASKKRIMAVMIALVSVSFLVEYFGFGWRPNVTERSEKEVFTAGEFETVLDGFEINEKGTFISKRPDATLQLLTDGSSVNNLRLELPENPNYGLTVSYANPVTGEETVLEKKFQNTIRKNVKENFLRTLVFNIAGNPEKITIRAQEAGMAISTIEIDNSYSFNALRFLFVFGALSLVTFFVFFRKRIGARPEYGFLAVALVAGTLISFSEPRSYVSWDEFIHYKRADNLSLKEIVKKDVNDAYSRANSVPSSYSMEEQKAIDEYFNADIKDKNKKSKSGNDGFSLVESYNRLAYLPSSLAMMIGRLFNLPAHLVFVFGRWINVLIYASIVFFAIRKLQSGKMIMAVIALFPTAIFLASNYGYDWWVTGFSMLGSAYLFRELQNPDKKLKAKDAAVMIGSFVVGLGPKAIYFPIMLMLFLLGRNKFESFRAHRNYLIAVIFSILFVLGSFLLPFLIAGPGDGDGRGGEAVNAAEQVKFILSEPVEYAGILLNFISGYINPLNAEGYMVSFAYLGSIPGFYLVLALLAFVIVTDKNAIDKLTSTWRNRFFVSVIFLGTVALISTALYVDFTAVRSEIIAGVQSRYLIPLLFPLLFVLGSAKLRNRINSDLYASVVFMVISAVLLNGIWELIVRLHY